MKKPKQPDGAQKTDTALGAVAELNITTWAQVLISEISADLNDEEVATLQAQVAAISREAASPGTKAPDPSRPAIVRDRTTLKALATKVDAAAEVVVDIETTDLDPRKGVIVGVGIALPDGTFYIPVNHRFEQGGALLPSQLTLVEVLDALRLEEKSLINHNTKFELRWLKHHGNITLRFVWDTMIAARLLHSDLPADLETVAVRELDVPKWDLPASAKTRMSFLPIEQVAAYCAKDCWHTLMIYRRQMECLV